MEKRVFYNLLLALIFFAGLSSLNISFVYSNELEDIDPQVLLKEIDDNLWSNTKHIEGKLIVDNGRRVRTMEVETWMEGVVKSYSYYKSPARERGTKMLKLDRKLWMYTPQTDRKILIAGHLLRQSMMGSDLSYEDMLEDKKLSISYSAKISGVENIEGIQSMVLDLTALEPQYTYQFRKVWTDPKKKIVLKEERFAKSGKLLKKIEFKDYFPIEGRLFPRRMIFRDMLKENTQTIYQFDEIHFDVNIPKKYFSKRVLKR